MRPTRNCSPLASGLWQSHVAIIQWIKRYFHTWTADFLQLQMTSFLPLNLFVKGLNTPEKKRKNLVNDDQTSTKEKN